MTTQVTRTIDNWDAYNNHVERQMDNAAYSAAHPDDVLFLCGPARKSRIVPSATSGPGSLMALGAVQMFNASSQLPVQPTKGIGSSRKFFLIDTDSNQVQISRLSMNHRNLLRALYHSAVEAGIDVGDRSIIGVEASYKGRDKQQFWTNLGSPIYRLPIGFGMAMRDRGKSHIGGYWFELGHITSWNITVASGQASIVENVTLTFDRILPFGDSSTVGRLAALFDAALGEPNLTADEKARAGATDLLT